MSFLSASKLNPKTIKFWNSRGSEIKRRRMGKTSFLDAYRPFLY